MQTTALFMNYFCNETGYHIIMYNHNSPTKGFRKGRAKQVLAMLKGGTKSFGVVFSQ